MHETRNFVLVLLVVAGLIWGVLAWFVFGPEAPLLALQKAASLLLFLGAGAYTVYAFGFEDKLPDHLAEVVGTVYYGADGVAFMPMIRHENGQAELCVYYQNRFENPAQTVVHIRPPEDSFIIQPGIRDVHFTFKAGGGDFGVIRQPIAVPEHLQGEVIDVELAAVSFYPRSKGSRLRRQAGMPCGALLVDWGGAAFKTGVHQVSGQVELQNPVRMRLSMPKNVNAFLSGRETWRQECVAVGTST